MTIFFEKGILLCGSLVVEQQVNFGAVKFTNLV